MIKSVNTVFFFKFTRLIIHVSLRKFLPAKKLYFCESPWMSTVHNIPVSLSYWALQCRSWPTLPQPILMLVWPLTWDYAIDISLLTCQTGPFIPVTYRSFAFKLKYGCQAYRSQPIRMWREIRVAQWAETNRAVFICRPPVCLPVALMPSPVLPCYSSYLSEKCSSQIRCRDSVK